jgi:VWFA-related protein
VKTAAFLLAGAAAVIAQAGQAPIRSGVELVAVDVQVVERSGDPVSGLQPGDFEVFIDGRRRNVLSAEFVRYGAGAAATKSLPAAPAVTAPSSPVAGPRRMFIIAVDEHSVRIGAARAATDAARRFIDRLGPDDLVGLFAYPTGAGTVNLTTDHASIRAGLDKISGLFERPMTKYGLSPGEVIDIASGDRDTLARVTARECRTDPYCRKELPLEAQSLAIMFEMKISQSLGGLRGLIGGLATVPGRKILVLVSGGLLVSDRADGRVGARSEMTALGRDAAAANTTVYALHMDSSFLDAFAADGKMSSTLFRDSSMYATGLEMVAGAAGGDVMRIEGGTPDRAFDRVLRETSAHYLLGVEVNAADRDGRAHNIRVEVKRRGSTVRSRTMVMIPRAATAVRAPAVAEPEPVSPPAALAEPLPPPAAEGPGTPDPTPLQALLRRAASYLAQYEREVPAVVSEEEYNQRAGTGPGTRLETRRLRSDMLVIADQDLGWVGFRDVFEVDGGPVRDRDARLANLFLEPHADRLMQARRIAAESARFNLNTPRYDIQRTINMPMMALRFLRAENQHRSTFKHEGNKGIDGIETSLISFEERAKPRIIASEDDAAARGRFWLDATGRVVRSELSFETRAGTGVNSKSRERVSLRSLIKVSYGEEPRLKLWMPLSMEERYYIGGVNLEGNATYSNFRRFKVDTSTTMKAP